VTGTWVTEQGGMTSATKILAAGDMIGYIQDNAGGVPVLWAKQGLNGTWYDEYGPVNAAAFTSTGDIVIRSGSVLLAQSPSRARLASVPSRACRRVPPRELPNE
jgi:hypothetical protein